MVEDWEAWCHAVHGAAKSQTKKKFSIFVTIYFLLYFDTLLLLIEPRFLKLYILYLSICLQDSASSIIKLTQHDNIPAENNWKTTDHLLKESIK